MLLPARKTRRLIVAMLLMLLLLPLINFYILQALDPFAVTYQTPRGEAVKVAAGGHGRRDNAPLLTRLFSYLHDFFQNGL